MAGEEQSCALLETNTCGGLVYESFNNCTLTERFVLVHSFRRLSSGGYNTETAQWEGLVVESSLTVLPRKQGEKQGAGTGIHTSRSCLQGPSSNQSPSPHSAFSCEAITDEHGTPGTFKSSVSKAMRLLGAVSDLNRLNTEGRKPPFFRRGRAWG